MSWINGKFDDWGVLAINESSIALYSLDMATKKPDTLMACVLACASRDAEGDVIWCVTYGADILSVYETWLDIFEEASRKSRIESITETCIHKGLATPKRCQSANGALHAMQRIVALKFGNTDSALFTIGGDLCMEMLAIEENLEHGKD